MPTNAIRWIQFQPNSVLSAQQAIFELDGGVYMLEKSKILPSRQLANDLDQA
jgi:hypothetical protein